MPGTPSGPSADHEPPPWERPATPASGRVLGGTASFIADRLGLNPFWLRMTFVVLTLAGGLGIVLYVGLWLILVVGREADRSMYRVIGSLVIVLGGLYLLGDRSRTGFVSGTGAVVALLAGLALALWQPRVGTVPPTAPIPSFVHERPTGTSERRSMPSRPRREPSLLGRATLALAVVVAAVGALIDQANGGRLHPEQWLGAAAVVCGIGLLVGVVRGRARWLIVPAAMFAGAGYVGGAAAEIGVSIDARGDEYVSVGPNSPPAGRVAIAFGDLQLNVDGAPASPQMIDARLLLGDLHVAVDGDADTAIELRWKVDHGSVTIDGVTQPDESAVRMGSGDAPLVVIEARIWRGDIDLYTYQSQPFPTPDVTDVTATTLVPVDEFGQPVPGAINPTFVTDGVSITSDGWIVLGDGEVLIDDTDQVVVGMSTDGDDGVVDIETTYYGQFRLLPRSLLLLPSGEVLDLQAIRARYVGTTSGPDVDPNADPDVTTTVLGVPTTVVPPLTEVGATTTVSPTVTTVAPSGVVGATTTIVGG